MVGTSNKKTDLKKVWLLERFWILNGQISDPHRILLDESLKDFVWGRFHESWAQGTNHRDSSIHLHPTPIPNFLRSFLLAQKLGTWA